MRVLQLATLALFGLFAVLTTFFQLRAGMKQGKATRAGMQPSVQDAERRYSRLASRCAVISIALLALCMAIGAINR